MVKNYTLLIQETTQSSEGHLEYAAPKIQNADSEIARAVTMSLKPHDLPTKAEP